MPKVSIESGFLVTEQGNIAIPAEMLDAPLNRHGQPDMRAHKGRALAEWIEQNAKAGNFTDEGADVLEQEVITAPDVVERPKDERPKPGTPGAGKLLLDMWLKTYPESKPGDFRKFITSMKYAERMGSHWVKVTRK